MIARAALLMAAPLLVAGLLALTVGQPWDSIGLSARSDGPTSAAGSEGGRRNAVLRDITALYVARGKDVSSGMRSGVEFAPTAFLNAELERQEAKWRVGGVRPRIEFFEVS